jgi:hypothetical protein
LAWLRWRQQVAASEVVGRASGDNQLERPASIEPVYLTLNRDTAATLPGG